MSKSKKYNKTVRDHRSEQLDHQNPKYWQSRGFSPIRSSIFPNEINISGYSDPFEIFKIKF
jgi:hypothetical protein